ncbi:unnamed protein product [Lupinus luteus]|uniref:Uncharacterized protein n=1 Tax=Lupinus luteus TaxID=3873 RepID=A0AAV1WUT3_LUPLU
MSKRMKEIKDLLAKMKDGSDESVSSVPIKLNHLNAIVSILAPELYTEQQLGQLGSFSNMEDDQLSLIANATTSRKRSCSNGTQQIWQEETNTGMNKKSRTMPLPIAATEPPQSPPSLPLPSPLLPPPPPSSPSLPPPSSPPLQPSSQPLPPSSPSLPPPFSPPLPPSSPPLPPSSPSLPQPSSPPLPPSSPALPPSSPAAAPPSPPQQQEKQLPNIFMERITELNGSDVKFLMHKKLCLSDVKQNNNRLSMPRSQIACEFLTEDEHEKLNERKDDPTRRLIGMEITVMDPFLREYKMTLKKWEMKKNPEDDEMKGVIYNLVTNWSTSRVAPLSRKIHLRSVVYGLPLLKSDSHQDIDAALILRNRTLDIRSLYRKVKKQKLTNIHFSSR